MLDIPLMKLIKMSNKRVKSCEIIILHDICMCQEHQSARSGLEWLQCVLDRKRFKDRIQRISPIIENVLKKKLSLYSNSFKK